MNVRERLAELIRQSGMTQSEIARRVGEPHAWVNKRVLGLTDIKADDLPRLAKALGITPAEFWRDGNPFEREQAVTRQMGIPFDNMLQEEEVIYEDIVAAGMAKAEEIMAREIDAGIKEADAQLRRWKQLKALYLKGVEAGREQSRTQPPQEHAHNNP